MTFPVVSIVGRPNVGKSSLLNRLASRTISIVDEEAGVTRDRVSAVVTWGKWTFELVDTGGMTFGRAQDAIALQVARQIEFALSQADLILFVVDVREGITPADLEVAGKLRSLGKPVLVVANKADNEGMDNLVGEFFALGLGEPIAASALHGRGRGELLERITAGLPEAEGKGAPPEVKVAIIGRRNVGKSTLINTLAREERAIVSETPGTTRDSYDVQISWDGHELLVIDTAGLRNPSSVKSSVEYYSLLRTERSIRRADVVLLLIDAREDISRIDKKAAAYICEQYKPCVVAVNKWDLVEGLEPEKYVRYIEEHLRGMAHAPISFISAKTGFNVRETVGLVFSLFEQWRTRVSTGQLNSVIQELFTRRSPRPIKKRMAKVYYATQVSVGPPAIVLFANDPPLFSDSYLRYLEHGLREKFPFGEVPLKLVVRKRVSMRASSA